MGNVIELSARQEHEFMSAFFDLSSETHFWFIWRFQAFLAQLKDLGIDLREPLKVLDVGAGAGVLRKQIESHSEWIVDITDLDINGLTAAPSGRGKTYYYDILEKRPDLAEKYDGITLFDVLEHIDDTAPFVDAVLFHLRPKGRLFLNVPAMQWLYSRFDSVQGHCRRYTIETLEAEFADFGVRILDARYWGWINLPLLVMRKFLLDNFSGGKSDEEIYTSGFSPPGKLINELLLKAMRIELALPAQRLAGSSILLAVEKT